MRSSIVSSSATPPLFAVLLPIVGAMSGCASPESQADEAEAPLTYYRDVQPVIATHCGACHIEGGSAPFGLATYEELQAVAPVVQPAIESGSMPPWSADPECRTFQHERVMSAADKAIVLDWMAAGMPEGDPADAQPIEPPSQDLPEVSVRTRSALPYTPDPKVSDDYHCVVMDVDFAEPTNLSGYQVVPDERGVVHHIIFYLVPPSGAAAMLAADAATPEPGYPCFGSSGHGGQPMGVWAPGGLPMRFPAKSAFVLEAGAKIVAQMHYNTAGAAPGPDMTELHLAYLADEPELRVTMPILNGFFTIPGGDPAYKAEFSHEVKGGPRQIFSVMPHMHLLGRTIDLRRVRGGEETCVARVDDWEFHWQQFYDLKPTEFLEVREGDILRYSCVFDNSPENQPIVDGEQRTPGPVEFGEGTFDEMCLNVVAMIEPFTAAPSSMCEGLGACFEQTCMPDDGACFLGCAVQEPEACGGCVLQGIAACGEALCPSEVESVIACLVAKCDADLSDVAAVQGCLADVCEAEFDAEWACLGPQLLGGACNTDLAPCEIAY
jgi:hypothetical protein